MKSARFYVDSDLQAGTDLVLPDAVAHHAVRVLRLATGAPVVLFNGRGGEFAAILRVDGKRAVAAISALRPVERESPLAVTLLQAWVATEKLDWIVEKAVELGAVRIVLFGAERSCSSSQLQPASNAGETACRRSPPRATLAMPWPRSGRARASSCCPMPARACCPRRTAPARRLRPRLCWWDLKAASRRRKRPMPRQ